MAPTSARDYPTLGFDPAPGDVYQVERLRNDLRSSFDAMTEISNVLRGADEGEWRGSAAVAFRDLLDNEAKGKIDDATRAFEKAYGAMDTWARELDGFQSRAATYENLAARAAEDLAAAQSSLAALGEAPTGEPPEDPAERDQLEQDDRDRERLGGDVRGAQSRLDGHVAAARRMLDDEYTPEGDRLAGRLDDAIGIAPPEPGWFSSALDSLGDFADQLGDFLADLADLALKALEELAPLLEVIGELAGLIAGVLGVLSIVFPALAPFALAFAVVAFLANYGAAAGRSGSFLAPLGTAKFWLDAGNVALNALGVGLWSQGLRLGTPSFAALFRSGTTFTTAQGLNFAGSYKVWQLGAGYSVATSTFAAPKTIDMVTGGQSPTQRPSVVG